MKKIFLVLLVNISVTAFASDTTINPDSSETKSTDTTPGNPNGTGTATYDNGTGRSTYDNGTGRSTYDNGTGRSTYNNGTGVNVQKKTTVKPIVKPKKTFQNLNRKLTLQGVLPDDADKVIQFAKDAGATDAQLEGNVLKVFGSNFNQDTFETWMVDSIPGSKIQN